MSENDEALRAREVSATDATVRPEEPSAAAATRSPIGELPTLAPGADLHSTVRAALGERAGEAVPDLRVVSPSEYQTVAEVARGGMGRIVAAVDAHLGRAVALKEALGEEGEDPRFVREALITARLQHPAIVPVYEVGRWPTGRPFYAMKLVEGRSLDDVIAERKTLASRLEMLGTVVAACDALAYAHSEGILHRDLKPANVLVGSYGETVVVDWGLAKDLNVASDATAEPAPAPSVDVALRARELAAQQRSKSGSGGKGSSAETMAGAVLGTAAYMPPEQARGEAVGPAADVYALGAMLYHLLTGRPPFEGASGLLVLSKVVSGPPTPVEQLEPETPAELCAIVARAMAYEARDRYPSAAELARDLRRFQTGQLVAAYRYTPLARVRRFVARNAAAVGIAAVSLALLALLTTTSFSRIMRARDEAMDARAAADARAEEARRAHALSNARGLLAEARRADAERRPGPALALLRALATVDVPELVRETTAERLLDRSARPAYRALRGHTGAIAMVFPTNGGESLLSSAYDQTVRLWDARTGAPGRIFEHPAQPLSVDLSGDGARLYSGDLAGTLRAFDVATGDVEVTVEGAHADGVFELVVLPGGEVLSFGLDRRVRLSAPETLALVAETRIGPPPDPELAAAGVVSAPAVAFAPDASGFATVTEEGRLAYFGADLVERFAVELGAMPVDMVVEGERLLLAHPGGIEARSLATGRLERPRHALDTGIRALFAASDRGELVVIDTEGAVRILDGTTFEPKRTLPFDAPDGNVSFSYDGSRVLLGSEVRDVRTGARVVSLCESIAPCSFGGASTELVCAAGDEVRIYGLPDAMQSAASLPASMRGATGVRVGRGYVLGLDAAGRAHAVALTGGAERATALPIENAGLGPYLGLAADGALVVGTWSAVAVLRPGEDALTPLPEAHAPPMAMAVAAEAGELWVGRTDGSLRAVRLADGSVVRDLRVGDDVRIESVAVSSDGSVLVVGRDGGRVEARARDGRVLAELIAPSDGYRKVFLDPAGARVAVADGARLDVFALPSGARELGVRMTDPVRDVLFGEGSIFVATADAVQVRRSSDGALLEQLPCGGGEEEGPYLAADGDDVVCVTHDVVVRMRPSEVELPSVLAWTGARTNLRVCAGDHRVVPVLPFPAADSVWAPDDACRAAPRE